jgi:hypothetical protein
MKDIVLKKEFNKKDVNRLRNLIQGKYGEKTQSQVGYKPKQKHHIEGEIWESNGQKWTITNGVKQNITKLDLAKKIHNVPLFCPNCSSLMKNRNDKTYYKIHSKCFDCVIDMELELKKQGKWDDYQKQIKNQELDNTIKEFKEFIKNKLEESNNSYMSEEGDLEKWVGKIDNNKVEEYINEVVEYLNNLKT